MDEAAILERYISEEGLRMTGPRKVVLEAFLGAERHVTAEELHALARRGDPGIGQATVFRAMKLFVAAGLAREARRSDGGMQYEHAWRHEHHDHLVCVSCGLVVEFVDPGIERAQEAVYARHGFVPGAHRMELSGTCPACARKGRRKRG